MITIPVHLMAQPRCDVQEVHQLDHLSNRDTVATEAPVDFTALEMPAGLASASLMAAIWTGQRFAMALAHSLAPAVKTHTGATERWLRRRVSASNFESSAETVLKAGC